MKGPCASCDGIFESDVIGQDGFDGNCPLSLDVVDLHGSLAQFHFGDVAEHDQLIRRGGDGQLFDYIHDGGRLFTRGAFISAMPGFSVLLDDGEIWAVIAYVKSRWPEETRVQQRRANFIGSLHAH